MYLVRLVYASKIGESGINPSIIEDILVHARTYNHNHGITGMLAFNSNYFLQCLEGARTPVNDLYATITQDPRHQNIVILDYDEIAARAFPQWAMGYAGESALQRPLLLKYSNQDTFNPFQMSGHSAYLLLKALSEQLPDGS